MQTKPELPILEPKRLTGLLRSAGVLPNGEVHSVVSADSGAFNSSTLFLSLGYRGEAVDQAPRHLVLKQNTPEVWSVAAGIDEVNFYLLIGSLGDHPAIIPRCYAAEIDPLTGNSFLLLEDLRHSHAPPITRSQQIGLVESVPKQADQEAVIDTLSKLHGYWWNRSELFDGRFEIGYWSRSEERFHLYLEKRRSAWLRLLAQEGSQLPAAWRDFYERLFDCLSGFWHRNLAPRFETRLGLTLIHGDAYFANFLCPRKDHAAPAYLLDWQSPTCDLGAYDLVNLLASFWTRTQRREDHREMRLLQRYFAELTANGVMSYTWENLCADYRAGIIFWVLMPVQDGGDGSPWSYCKPKMSCLIDAFEDWECAALLNK